MTKMSSRRARILPDRLTRRLIQLLIGLMFCGSGVALTLLADLGAAPWDVLAQGISRQLSLTFGTVTIIISGIVLLLWIPLRQRLGFGTIANAILVGVFADVGLWLFPRPEGFAWQLTALLLGIIVTAVGIGIYIGAGLGPGPRDGLMTGLHARTGWPIWVVRTGIEAFALLGGWLCGGTVGLGTVAVVLLIGPLCQFTLTWFVVSKREPRIEQALTGEIPIVSPG